MLLSKTRANCVRLPYKIVRGGDEAKEKHVELTYVNESVMSLRDGKAMYILWHGGGVGEKDVYDVPGLWFARKGDEKKMKTMSTAKFIGLCIQGAICRKARSDGGGGSGESLKNRKRRLGGDEVLVRNDIWDDEFMVENFLEAGFEFMGFGDVMGKKMEILGDVAFAERENAVQPYELWDGWFKVWWKAAAGGSAELGGSVAGQREERMIDLMFARVAGCGGLGDDGEDDWVGLAG